MLNLSAYARACVFHIPLKIKARRPIVVSAEIDPLIFHAVANDKGLFPEWKQGTRLFLPRERARDIIFTVLPESLLSRSLSNAARAADKTFRCSRKYVYVCRSFTNRNAPGGSNNRNERKKNHGDDFVKILAASSTRRRPRKSIFIPR